MRYEDFKKGVKSYEEASWFADHIYLDTINELNKTRKRGKIDLPFVEQVLKTYLIQWGQMVRVVGREENGIDWKALTSGIQKVDAELAKHRQRSFIKVDFAKNKGIRRLVEESYNELRMEYVGPTAVSKILHLLWPRFFVMWDDRIRTEAWEWKKKTFPDSAKGYLEYLAWVQGQVLEAMREKGFSDDRIMAKTVIGELGPELELESSKKTLAKLADECLWWAANR
jgi:hypothetical protein